MICVSTIDILCHVCLFFRGEVLSLVYLWLKVSVFKVGLLQYDALQTFGGKK